MATATTGSRAPLAVGNDGDAGMAGGATSPSQEQPVRHGQPQRRTTYDCACGHALRFFGGGRHRVYFEIGDAGSADPIMNGVCPGCAERLPGKNGS